MREPERLTRGELAGRCSVNTLLAGSARGVSLLSGTLPCTVVDPQDLDAGRLGRADGLVVVGSGRMLDRVKHLRGTLAPDLPLHAVATLWGSGAEASPVVVLDAPGTKRILLDPVFLPTTRMVEPGFAATVPPGMAMDGCADVWAHALEGLLSPLASAGLRVEMARLVNELVRVQNALDPCWFDLGARAAFLQAHAGVGLAHGLAHQVEPAGGGSHASLCRAFLYPVWRFDLERSSHLLDEPRRLGVDVDAVAARIRALWDSERFARAWPVARARWSQVLRDPCTRTNCASVRPGDAAWFDACAAELGAP